MVRFGSAVQDEENRDSQAATKAKDLILKFLGEHPPLSEAGIARWLLELFVSFLRQEIFSPAHREF